MTIRVQIEFNREFQIGEEFTGNAEIWDMGPVGF